MKDADPCEGVTGLTCEFGCASTGSCGECTKCKTNPDCNVTSLMCAKGCATTNSCGKCIKCNCTPNYSAVIPIGDCGCLRWETIDIGCGVKASSCAKQNTCDDYVTGGGNSTGGGGGGDDNRWDINDVVPRF